MITHLKDEQCRRAQCACIRRATGSSGDEGHTGAAARRGHTDRLVLRALRPSPPPSDGCIEPPRITKIPKEPPVAPVEGVANGNSGAYLNSLSSEQRVSTMVSAWRSKW